MKYCIICYKIKQEGVFAHNSCLTKEHEVFGLIRPTTVWVDEVQEYLNV